MRARGRPIRTALRCRRFPRVPSDDDSVCSWALPSGAIDRRARHERTLIAGETDLILTTELPDVRGAVGSFRYTGPGHRVRPNCGPTRPAATRTELRQVTPTSFECPTSQARPAEVPPAAGAARRRDETASHTTAWEGRGWRLQKRADLRKLHQFNKGGKPHNPANGPDSPTAPREAFLAPDTPTRPRSRPHRPASAFGEVAEAPNEAPDPPQGHRPKHVVSIR